MSRATCFLHKVLFLRNDETIEFVAVMHSIMANKRAPVELGVRACVYVRVREDKHVHTDVCAQSKSCECAECRGGSSD